MKIYHAVEFEKDTNPRAHPWSAAEADESQRYYDFKLDPSLIPKVLEDFRPFSGHAAIQRGLPTV